MSSTDIVNLIHTKFQPPQISNSLVQRPSLLKQLNDGIDRKLILVSAPAGFGKTTLIASWLRQAERPFVWISLDENEDDLSLFLNYFITAIRNIYPNACVNSYQLLQSSQMLPLNQIATALINDLHALAQPVILVLDDYQHIQDISIQQMMDTLLKRAPVNLQLVICSRSDPFLPLPSLRAQGAVVEIRADDLRFTSSEAREFFRLNGRYDIDSSQVLQINERVEGWAVGLRLAFLSLNSSAGQETWLSDRQARSDQFYSEYLFSEVLTHQPVPVQDFLLHTSILDRFCLDLYLALRESNAADRAETEEILAEIKAANLFIVPIGEKTGWYRYHHLFRDMLRQKLISRVGPEHMSALHQSVVAWFVENGFLEEAFKHALAAADLDLAVAIVEDNSRDNLNELEQRTLERWMANLPDEIIWQRPQLLITKAWLLYRHWRLYSLERILDRLADLLDSPDSLLDSDKRQLSLGQLYTLRSAVEFHNHFNYARTIAVAEEAVRRLPAPEGGALSTAYINRAFALAGQAKTEKANRELKDAISDPSPNGPAKGQLFLGLGILHYLSGNLLDLSQVVDRFMHVAEQISAPVLAPRWLDGLRKFEHNQLEEAATSLTVMYEHRYQSNFVAGFYCGLALARINQIQADFEQAQLFLDIIQTDSLRQNNAAFLDTIAAFQAWQWWLLGDEVAAYRWAHSYQPQLVKDPLLAFDPPGHLWARLLLALGKPFEKRAAATYVRATLSQLQPTQFSRRKLQLLAQMAAAEYDLGKVEAARGMIEKAVLLGQTGGHIRSFLDVGQTLIPLLRSLDPQLFVPGYLGQLLTAFGVQTKSPPLAETTILTAREVEIMKLIAAGKSNQEIADTLVISIHTAKRHASNIYNKLAVNNRRQAIHKARKLGLLS